MPTSTLISQRHLPCTPCPWYPHLQPNSWILHRCYSTGSALVSTHCLPWRKVKQKWKQKHILPVLTYRFGYLNASMEQAHLIWLTPPTPIQLDRSTVFSTSPSPFETVFYAATTVVDNLNTKDIELGVRYRTGDETWLDTVGIPITWHDDPIEWMKNDLGKKTKELKAPPSHHSPFHIIDTINHWAPILYPYKAHLATQLSPYKDWISLVSLARKMTSSHQPPLF